MPHIFSFTAFIFFIQTRAYVHRTLVTLCGAILMVACSPSQMSSKNLSSVPSLKSEEKAVIAYYLGEDIDELRQYPLSKLTHIIYSFLFLEGNALTFRNEKSKEVLRQIVALKKDFPHLKIMVALGGWGGCEFCSQVFSSEEGRSEFIASAKHILEEYQLDGLDLDWEYPVVEGYPGHRHVPEDKEHFTYLVQGLRKAFADEHLLSFAAGGYNEYLQQAIDWQPVMEAVDWVNLMSYDLVNGYSTLTGHHTALYSQTNQAESTHNAVQYLLQEGVGSQKIVIGAAFYARVWEKVKSDNNGLFQTEAKFKTSVDYRNLPNYFKEHNFSEFWDVASQAPYAFSQDQGLFATYDNIESVSKKTQYLLDHNLKGIMFWQITGDTPKAGLIDAIDDSLKVVEK